MRFPWFRESETQTVKAARKRLPHFVENYQAYVEGLVQTLPIDEAMAEAVGGDFATIGPIERDILRWAGLRDGMALIDMGCGSGRLAKAIEGHFAIDYTGVDAVQPLLDYARRRMPQHFKFVAIDDLSLPLPAASADMIAVFAVFAHMLASEAFLYLRDMRRVLKPGGCVVMSFLEISEPAHWADFMAEVESLAGMPFLHQFVERPMIEEWCKRLDFVRETFVGRADAPWGTGALGQAVAILRKPACE